MEQEPVRLDLGRIIALALVALLLLPLGLLLEFIAIGNKLNHSALVFAPPAVFSLAMAFLSHRLFRSTVLPLLLAFVSLFVAIIFLPDFVNAHPTPGRFTACKSNLKNLSTALEMYASDNQGLYPTSLDRLLPGNYLKTIPTCSGAKKDSYSASYAVNPEGNRFTMMCQGTNHPELDIKTDFPQYTSDEGLLEGRP